MNPEKRLSSVRIAAILFLLFLITFFFTSEVVGQSTVNRSMIWKGKSIRVRGYDLMIEYAPGSESVAREYAQAKNAEVIKKLGRTNTMVLRMPTGTDLDKAVTEAMEMEGIIAASPVVAGVPLTTPVDYFYTSGKQWPLKNTGQDPPGGISGADIHIEAAWAYTTGSSNVRIAILDSGIPIEYGSLSHPDLNGNRYELCEAPFKKGDNSDFNDLVGHGTMVTGIVTANWGYGGDYGKMAGVVQYSKILIYKVYRDEDIEWDQGVAWVYPDIVIEEIENAADYDANIILCATGFAVEPAGLRAAVQYAASSPANAIIVAASGDYGINHIYYPAAFAPSESNVLSVGATDMNDQWVSAYSNYGTQLSVVAPGGGIGDREEGIITCVPENDDFLFYHGYSTYDYWSGTSLSAAHAAGVAALIRSRFPDATAAQVRNTLQLSSDDLGPAGYDPWYGFGRINAFNAVAMPVRDVELTETAQHHPRLNWIAPAHALPIAYYRIKKRAQGLSGQWTTYYYTTTSTSWTDVNVTIGGSLRIKYYVQAVDAVDYQHGAWDGPHLVWYDGGIDSQPGQKELEIKILPEEFALTSVYPNPFNSSATIAFNLPEVASVSVQVYNSVGRIVATLASGELHAGHHTLTWNADNIPSGVYFVRCATLGEAFVRKITYVK